MKKSKQTIFILIFVVALTLLSGCKNEPHVHTFEEKWTYDKDSHWHAASCEHKEEKSDPGAHDKVTTTIKEATETEDGLIKITCSVCGYSEEETVKYHTHTFSPDWETDENYHWHKANCGHDEISGKSKHTFVKTSDCTKTESVYKCSVCGYEKTVAERGRHSFDEDGVCTVCGGYKCGNDVAAIFDGTAKTLTVRGTGDMYGYTSSDYTDGKIKWSSLAFDRVIIEDGITSIGKYAFYKSSVKSAEIGKDVRIIDEHSFANAKVEMLTFSENGALYKIGFYAFSWTQLKSVELPLSMRILEAGAFNGSSNLTEIKLNEGIQELKSDIIFQTSVTVLHLPSTCKPSSNNFFWVNEKLTTITVEKDNPYMKSVDGILYSKDEDKLIGVPGGKMLVAIAETVETIGEQAFYRWRGKSVTLPESVKTIERNAFSYCANLESVSMGSKVESISESTFNYTPSAVEKLTITIAQPEGSISGYETCWRKYIFSDTKAIEVKWTGTTPTT